ncbi:MAG: ABC transporter ATP-binding protein [Burkholderiaceae bacterium]|nr:ABC transporter ATP-binding protein [Burkholderiaceae bacterium]
MFDIVCSGLKKVFQSGDRTSRPLDDLTVTIPAGEITAVIGESGCGKTTFLRMIAGLDKPNEGTLSFIDKDQNRQSPKVAVVFQEPRLFAWLTVRENIAMAIRHLPKDEQNEKVDQVLDLVRLTKASDLYPRELSGGMAQRVGLARALVASPDILLLDEAFSALDALTRQKLYQEFIRIHKECPMTTVLVTHDVMEAVLLSRHIHYFASGKVKASFEVPFDYPRSLSTPGCSELCDRILEEFF